LSQAGYNDRFVDQEFLEQTREYVSFLIKDLGGVSDFVRTLGISEIEGPLEDKIIEWLGFVREDLNSAIENAFIVSTEQGLKEAYKIHEKMREYEIILSLLKQAIDQRFHGHVTEKIHFFEPTRVEAAGSKVYKAIDKLVARLIGSFFPEYIANESVSVVVFSSVPGYQVWIPTGEPTIAVVQVPEIDLHRCRYWTCLGHETAHQRYGAYPIMGIDHSGNAYKELKREMVQDLENLALRSFGFRSEDLALDQFQEVLCDFSSSMLLGPSDLLTLMTTLSYPRLEGTAFSPHPPLAARVRYMFKYLNENIPATSSGIFGRRLQEWQSSWRFLERTIKRPVRERLYLEGFNQIVDEYYNDIVTVARDFLEIPNQELFKPETWEWAEVVHENEDEISNASVLDLLQVTWAKRWMTFKNVFQGSATEFLYYHQFERKFTYDFINRLSGGDE